MRIRCPENLDFAYTPLPPYIYKSHDSKITGIFTRFLSDAVNFWCAGKTNITYTEVLSGFHGLESKIVNNTADVIFPIPSKLKSKFFLGRPYVPIIESPGIAFFSSKNPNAGDAIINALSNGWPALIIVILSAMIAGIAFWFIELTRDSRSSKNHRRENIHFSTEGLFRGFYWAMVTMTTVGYGDFYPKSTIGRLLATLWILTGTVIISLFTASITTILLASCLTNDVTMNRAKIAVIKSSTEYKLAVRRHAIPMEQSSVQDMVQMISSARAEGALLDSFVAGYYQESFNKFRLVDIIEHVFSYGSVLTRKGLWIEPLIREYARNNKDKLFDYMSNSVRPLKSKNFATAAVEKSSSLLDIRNNAMSSTLLVIIAIIGVLFIAGNLWDRCHLRKRKGYISSKRSRSQRANQEHNLEELQKSHMITKMDTLREMKLDIEKFRDLLKVQLALAQRKTGLSVPEDDWAISNIELIT
eukprot:gene19961-21915_t